MKPPTEFRVSCDPGALIWGKRVWLVYWWGCDSRVIARCSKRHEAQAIARALNETGVAAKWYKRARARTPGR